MSEELRPCPFCGNEPVVEGNLVACNNLNCPTHDNYWTDPMIFTCDQWNTRPIEDSLNARIAELEAAQRWHAVDDGDLPIFGKSIMFYDSSSEEIYRGVYTASHHWRANYFNEKCATVTHWMPLPTPPEVQE